MDLEEDDQLGSVSSLGLHRVLASAGVDPNTFSSFFDRTSGGTGESSSSRRFEEIEAEDDEDKYEDDISDNELPAESAEDARAREREQAARKAEEERWYRRAMELQRGVGPAGGEEGAKRRRKEKEREMQTDRSRQIWPEFEKGKRLKMTEVLYETPADRRAYQVALGRKKRRKIEDRARRVTYPLLVAPDTTLPPTKALLLPELPPLATSQPGAPLYETPLGTLFDSQWVKGARDLRRRAMTKPPPGLVNHGAKLSDPAVKQEEPDSPLRFGMSLELGDWEKDIIMCSLDVPNGKPIQPLAPRNDLLEAGDWIKDVIWDAGRVSPSLLESDEDEGESETTAQKKALVLTAKSKLDPFNMSNDHLYEHTREARFRIRQTFGAIEVFHAGPAKALQMPFYKTSLSKTEARSWRRPALQFPTGVSITFSKLKSNPSASVSTKKKQMMSDPSERFKTTRDLTLSEKGPYVLLEFSEEYPPLMSGYGMGTTIVNYYRKKDDKDEHVPKLDFGQPSILNVGDAEPFLLGYVDRGKVTQVIHNNLIRAPIFRHQPETTDFLLIRQTINGHATYYIRPIANIFTVGQTVPNESEIPGPHARKNTTYARIRLQIVAWLLINKSKQKRFKIGKLLKYFPDQTELQMRQRLKIKGAEFLVYNRSQGPNQGYWMLNPNPPPEKDGTPWPSTRQEVLEMASPESAMLYEAMQVGARHLHDAGYSKTAEGKDEDDVGDETGLDIEQQLAVWSTTMNYKKAEQQKAWLVVHGEGDPTGRGEGFSFLRTNMKNYFLRKGETEQGRRLEAEAKANGNPVKISNAEQNRIYEEEKRKVWDLQWAALSNARPPELAPEDEERVESTPAGLGPRFGRADSRRAFSRGNSLAATPMFADSPREFSPMSADGESTFTGNPLANKVMRIKRVVKGRTQYEIVRDPAVIASYRRRIEERKIEHFKLNPELLQPTGNPEEDELRRVALLQELESVRKNQARRLARKKYSNRELLDESEIEPGKRKCGACGQIGHTRANRACPMYNANASQSVGPSPVGMTPGQTPGGYSTGGPTPGAGGYGDYFGSQGAGGDGGVTPSTAIKIKLGGGQR